MPSLSGSTDAVKHSLRGLKRLESKIRFGSSVPPEGRRLVWDTFFDLHGFASNTARYPLAALCGMDAAALQAVIDEYFFYVYYRFYRENGIAQAAIYDPELLKRFGLSADADRAAIKNRFRELAMRYHPDHGGDAKKFMEMMEMYKKLTEE
ncbi:MAG TPA: J domain-containing protein [Clostridia bacterium]|nr:J domain-containing protein [Clostridia bacterium]